MRWWGYQDSVCATGATLTPRRPGRTWIRCQRNQLYNVLDYKPCKNALVRCHPFHKEGENTEEKFPINFISKDNAYK